MVDPALSILLYGSDEALPLRRKLKAGPVTLELEDGGLRYLKIGDKEFIRGIYASVRDKNWKTVAPRFDFFDIDEEPDCFRIHFAAEHKDEEVHFEWLGSIIGEKDGTLRFEMKGEAKKTFLKNRIGFCILHPIELAGEPVCIHRMDGIKNGVFPKWISPHQPFQNMLGMSYPIYNNLEAKLAFEGDLFEMEDQRNWTDASYKTYCTPLNIPYPVEIQAGEKITQSVTLRMAGNYPANEGDFSGNCRKASITVGTESKGKLPKIGLGVVPRETLNPREINLLKSLNLSYLRATVNTHTFKELETAEAAAEALDVDLELEVIVKKKEDDFRNLLQEIVNRDIQVERIFAFQKNEFVSSGKYIEHLEKLRREFHLDFRIGGGTNANFAEFNRAALPIGQMEVAGYTINPQLHAFDLTSIVETLAAQSTTVESACELVGGMPLSVGPVTFKPRLNPYATNEDAAQKAEERGTQLDTRQHSLFGACWTLGSIKRLADAGAAYASYYETSGPLGIIEAGGGRVYPLYHVFADIGEFINADMVEVSGIDPYVFEALALRLDSRLRLLIANFTNEELPLVIEPPRLKSASIRILDETTSAKAAENRHNFIQFATRLLSAAERFEINLLPFAIACIDFELYE